MVTAAESRSSSRSCSTSKLKLEASHVAERLQRLKAPRPTTQIKLIGSAQGLRMYVNGFRVECVGFRVGA